jgi:hypothetical protein
MKRPGNIGKQGQRGRGGGGRGAERDAEGERDENERVKDVKAEDLETWQLYCLGIFRVCAKQKDCKRSITKKSSKQLESNAWQVET